MAHVHTLVSSVLFRSMSFVHVDVDVCHFFLARSFFGTFSLQCTSVHWSSFMSFDGASWVRQLEQDSEVSAIESLVDENLQDELFKRGISDLQVYDLHRAEQALFFASCSPLLSSDLVWNELPSLYRCAADIAPGVVLCQIEVASLSLEKCAGGLTLLRHTPVCLCVAQSFRICP